MNRKMPVLMLASLGLLLASCGGSDASSNYDTSGVLKSKDEKILAYNTKAPAYEITNGKLTKSALTELVSKNEIEISTKELIHKDQAFPFYIVKDTKQGSETLNKYGIYSVPEDKIIVPFIYDNDSSINAFEGQYKNDYIIYFVGNTGSKSAVYDSYGNKITEINKNNLVFEMARLIYVPSRIEGVYYNLTLKFTDTTLVNGRYKDYKFELDKSYVHKGTEELKPGDFITGYYETNLDIINLPEYTATYIDKHLLVHKGDELISTTRLPNFAIDENGLDVSMAVDGHFIFQEIKQVPNEATDYSYFKMSEDGNFEKYSLKTTKLNLLTGKYENINLPYLIDTTSENNRQLKDKDGKFVYTLSSGYVIEKDKSLSSKVDYVFNQNLELVNDYTGFEFDNLIKLDKGFYTFETPKFEGTIIKGVVYNEKEEPVFEFKDSRLGKITIFPKYNMFIAEGQENKQFIIDTNGQIQKEILANHSVKSNSYTDKLIITPNDAQLRDKKFYTGSLKDGIKDTVIITSVPNFKKYEEDNILFTYKTAEHFVVEDFLGNKLTYELSKYPDIILVDRPIGSGSVRAFELINDGTTVDYLRVDLGLK